MKSEDSNFGINMALWLVENSSLTATQIADFCKIPIIDVLQMLDDQSEYNTTHVKINPIFKGYATSEDIQACEKDHKKRLKRINLQDITNIRVKQKKSQLVMSKRREIQNAVAWLIEFYPNLKDLDIVKLTHSTKATVASIRNGTNKKISSVSPKNPVVCGLCSQEEFDKIIEKFA